MSFAIFQTGGKQYRVKVGDVVKVEKLDVEKAVEFTEVLLAGDKVGDPLLKGAKVVADVIAQDKLDKVLVFKKKRRHNYRRTKGHQQLVTVCRIKEIKA